MDIHAHNQPAGILFWQAALFSGVAALFILTTVWWFYLSPLKRELPATDPPSPRLAAWLSGLLGLAAVQWVVGMLWDASMHIQTGEIPSGADFLWPPHLLLYSGFLLAFLVAAVVIGRVALTGWRSGQRDPRLWVRGQPFLGAVALASLYELMAIPGDALWHEIFGEDLTAWSPPHILLVLMMAVVIICLIGVVLQSRQPRRRVDWQAVLVIVMLGLMLNLVYIVGVLEWELPVRPPQVDERPVWFYPLVGGSLTFFALVLARQWVSWRGAATATALAFYLVRGLVSASLHLTDNIAPALPPTFILGALLMDLLPLDRIPSTALRAVALAGTFTLGYALLAFPSLASRQIAPTFSGVDLLVSLTALLAASMVMSPLALLAGRRLQPEGGPV